MVQLNLEKQIQSDISRYTSILNKYKSGKANEAFDLVHGIGNNRGIRNA
jgi:hypothetical protein